MVEQSGISQHQLARDAELSYAALHAWLSGVRAPRSDSLTQLANGLEARAKELQRLAEALRREVQRKTDS